MFAEKVADSRRDHSDYFWIYSANICDLFCEHLREKIAVIIWQLQRVLYKAHKGQHNVI